MLDKHPMANPVTGAIDQVTNFEVDAVQPTLDNGDAASAKDIETGSSHDGKEEFPSTEWLQDGVRQAEAITATWNKTSLRTAYAL